MLLMGTMSNSAILKTRFRFKHVHRTYKRIVLKFYMTKESGVLDYIKWTERLGNNMFCVKSVLLKDPHLELTEVVYKYLTHIIKQQTV